MLPSIYRKLQVEIWDHPTPVRERRRLAFVRDVLSAEADRREDEVHSLTLRIPFNDPAAAYIADHRLVRTQRQGGGDAEMWRIMRAKRVHATGGQLGIELYCEAWWGDFGRGGRIVEILDGDTLLQFARAWETPETLCALSLTGYKGEVPYVLGTVTPATPIEMTEFDHDTALSGLKKVEQAAKGRLRWVWSDDVGYTVTLEDATAAPVFGGAVARLGKNLVSLSREDDLGSAYTRYYAKGLDGLTLADAEWQAVEGPLVGQLTLTDDTGTRGPCAQPLWLDGYRVRKVGETGLGFPVENSAGTLDTPTTISAIGIGSAIQTGDRVELLDQAGNRLAYVDHPDALAAHGVLDKVEETEVPRHLNLIPNPRLDSDGVAFPSQWELVGAPAWAVIERNDDPDRVKVGGYGLEITATAAGQGVRSAVFAFRKTQRMPALTLVAVVVTSAGVAQAYVESLDAMDAQGNPLRFPANVLQASHGTAVDPYRATLALNNDQVPAGRYRAYVLSRGAGKWLVDGVTVSPTIGSELQELAIEGGPQVLWRLASQRALEEHVPIRRYAAELLHLYRLDPVKYASEKWEPGRALRVFDERLGEAVEVRITSVRERLDSLEASGSLEFSNERKDIRDLLGARKFQFTGERPRPQEPDAGVIGSIDARLRDRDLDYLNRVEFRVYKHAVESGRELQDAWVTVDSSVFPPVTTVRRPSEAPAGYEPTARLLRSGTPVLITGEAQAVSAHDPVQPILWTTEDFDADPAGDTLEITQVSIPGVISGFVATVAIPPRPDRYEWGTEGSCGVGKVTVTKPDGVRHCVSEGDIILPAAAPVAAFDATETGTAGTLLLDASESTGQELRYAWTIGIHTPPPPTPTFTMDPSP